MQYLQSPLRFCAKVYFIPMVYRNSDMSILSSSNNTCFEDVELNSDKDVVCAAFQWQKLISKLRHKYQDYP